MMKILEGSTNQYLKDLKLAENNTQDPWQLGLSVIKARKTFEILARIL